MKPGATLEGMFSFVATESPSPTTTESMIERNIKVFRVGTFTDMFGRTRTYSHADLDEAVSNFRKLREANIVPHVPIRANHTFSIHDVGGYLLDVRREGDFLIADLEFTEESMYSKWKKGTFRNRSLEIGQYVTNDGTKYNPVVLGLAFVDLPAVEGLYHLSTGDVMSGQQTNPPAGEPPAAPPAGEPPAAPPAGEPPAAPPAGEPAEPPASHGRQIVHSFRIAGQTVTDPLEVQRRIDALETFQTEQTQSFRTGLVDHLAAERIITGPQAEMFRKLVVDMTPEMFVQFREGYGVKEEAAIFGRHDLGQAGDGSGSGTPSTPAGQRAERIQVLEEIVKNHRRLGHTDEEIAKFGSFTELQQLKQQGT